MVSSVLKSIDRFSFLVWNSLLPLVSVFRCTEELAFLAFFG